MSDIAIRVENLGKQYRIGAKQERYNRFTEQVMDSITAPIRRAKQALQRSNVPTSSRSNDTIWALKDVSFEVQRGEVVGIIGRNGAGKSTLLKILSRITEPTTGRVELHGRVSSLLEVGTGFHPELTGRENVFLNGAILGMRREEIERKFDEIVAFSGVEQFLDTPVKRYSSGMQVRLAFAVAAHLEPEILLIDEVLAVGDAEFQKKCLGKMGEVARGGRTVLFVSHNMDAISALCKKAFVVNEGRISFTGHAPDAVGLYLLGDMDGASGAGVQNPVRFPRDPKKPVQVLQIALLGASGEPAHTLEYTESPHIHLLIEVNQPAADYVCILSLRDTHGRMVLHTGDNDESGGGLANVEPGIYGCRVALPERLLKPGRYFLSARIKRQAHRGTRLDIDVRDEILSMNVRDTVTRRGREGRYPPETIVAPAALWRFEVAPVAEVETLSGG